MAENPHARGKCGVVLDGDVTPVADVQPARLSHVNVFSNPDPIGQAGTTEQAEEFADYSFHIPILSLHENAPPAAGSRPHAVLQVEPQRGKDLAPHAKIGMPHVRLLRCLQKTESDFAELSGGHVVNSERCKNKNRQFQKGV